MAHVGATFSSCRYEHLKVNILVGEVWVRLWQEGKWDDARMTQFKAVAWRGSYISHTPTHESGTDELACIHSTIDNSVHIRLPSVGCRGTTRSICPFDGSVVTAYHSTSLVVRPLRCSHQHASPRCCTPCAGCRRLDHADPTHHRNHIQNH